PLAGNGRYCHGVVTAGRLVDYRIMGVRTKTVDLVPDFNDAVFPFLFADAEIGQNSQDITGLGSIIRVGHVTHMQYEICFEDLLEGCTEGCNQMGREIGYETDRV